MPRIEQHERSFDRRGAVLAMLSQLKQVCNHPEMVLSTGHRRSTGRSGKLDRLVELLGQVPDGDKSLVFTQYPGFDRLVAHLAERLGVEVGFFHGGLGARRREELLHAFDEPDGPRIMVVSIRAGGRGLNLRRRTTSSTSTAGGTRRSSSRRRIAPTGSGSASPSSSTASSAARRSRSGSTSCSSRSASSPTR